MPTATQGVLLINNFAVYKAYFKARWGVYKAYFKVSEKVMSYYHKLVIFPRRYYVAFKTMCAADLFILWAIAIPPISQKASMFCTVNLFFLGLQKSVPEQSSQSAFSPFALNSWVYYLRELSALNTFPALLFPYISPICTYVYICLVVYKTRWVVRELWVFFKGGKYLTIME